MNDSPTDIWDRIAQGVNAGVMTMNEVRESLKTLDEGDADEPAIVDGTH